MSNPTRDPNAPESYATFWEPLAPVAVPPAPAPDAQAAADAHPEFTEPTEVVSPTPRRERT